VFNLYLALANLGFVRVQNVSPPESLSPSIVPKATQPQRVHSVHL
jgi:hypothetical protein